jgi:hypothetical protein
VAAGARVFLTRTDLAGFSGTVDDALEGAAEVGFDGIFGTALSSDSFIF